MGSRIGIWFRRLFFYSSRQLYRRRRTYLSVFVTSVVLMTVVMTALEVFESTHIRDSEIAARGRYHVKIEGLLYDYSAEIGAESSVREAWSVPWSSWLASSTDASTPARVSVPSEGTDRALNITYIWGHAPGEGEIAVSDRLYSSVDWLEAGELNDLWFSATKMTYWPLTVSGIFTCNDAEACYAFVGPETAAAIDGETGAVTKYDNYFICAYHSVRFAAKTLDRLWTKLRLAETDLQQFSSFKPDSVLKLVNKYSQYLNAGYISDQVYYAATPVTLYVLPVIAASRSAFTSSFSIFTILSLHYAVS